MSHTRCPPEFSELIWVPPQDSGWTIDVDEPDDETNDYYGGADGPYNELHILQGKSSIVVATQSQLFDNCYREDLVSCFYTPNSASCAVFLQSSHNS